MSPEAIAILAELLLEALKVAESPPTKEDLVKLIERAEVQAVNVAFAKEFPGEKP